MTNEIDYICILQGKISQLELQISNQQATIEKFGDKIMRQEANMLKVIARNRSQRATIEILKAALVDRAAMLSEGLDMWAEMDTDDKAKAREKIACQLAHEMPEIFGDQK